jgi:acyl-CoA oxidase
LIPLVRSLRIVGCYAQTELGHGSNVAALETTASFNNDTQEWTINTPTVTATKFWPGSLGVMANHAMVFARTLVAGKDHGVQPFLVPIRSMEDHMPLPGVQVGDLGEKLGFSSVDNGFLAFDNVKIPRKNMMQRFMHIKKDG